MALNPYSPAVYARSWSYAETENEHGVENCLDQNMHLKTKKADPTRDRLSEFFERRPDDLRKEVAIHVQEQQGTCRGNPD